MTDLSEMVFPRNPLSPGTNMPTQAGPAMLDFNQCDVEGWAQGDNGGRATFVLDPAGSGRTVLRMEVRQGDDADHWGGARVEFDRYPFDQVEGTSAWFLLDWYVGDGVRGDVFRFPSSWAVMFQQFSEPDGSPPVALEVDGRTKQWVLNCRRTRYDETGRKQIGPVTLGARHFFALQMEFSEGVSGLMRAWHSVDELPDVTKPPVDERRQNNIYRGRSHPSVTLYCDKAQAAASFPWVGYFGRFARAASFERAVELSGWLPAYGDPPPDVDAAVAYLRLTLEWMRRSKLTGGLGYSVDRVRRTNAYKALVVLGGRWPA